MGSSHGEQMQGNRECDNSFDLGYVGYKGAGFEQGCKEYERHFYGRMGNGVHEDDADIQKTQERFSGASEYGRSEPYILLWRNGGQVSGLSQPQTRILESYWQVEQQSPRWFQESSGAWERKDELSFCAKCHSIYEIQGKALVYIEKVGHNAEIHFSIKEKIEISDLVALKFELLREFDVLFGWILRQNRGMRKVAEQIGFRYDGLRMFYGSSHGKVLEWYCYTVAKELVSKSFSSLIE